jgi:hypothetical protein
MSFGPHAAFLLGAVLALVACGMLSALPLANRQPA